MKIVRYLNEQQIQGAMPPFVVKNKGTVRIFKEILYEKAMKTTKGREK